MSALVERAEARVRNRAVNLRMPGRAHGRCVIETSLLVKVLHGKAPVHAIRATGTHYPGREHWAAIEWPSDADDPAEFTVVDLTARQFDKDAPVPWVGTLIDWYDVVCDWLNDHIDVAVHAPDPYEHDWIEPDPHWTDHYARDDHEPGDPMRDGLADAVDDEALARLRRERNALVRSLRE